MKLTRNIAITLSALAFGAVPAAAIAAGNGAGHGKTSAPGQTKTTKSTSSTSSTSNPKAYGRICAAENESKTHVSGMKGTPFSECVVALAHAAKSSSMSATASCKTESKKHVSGTPGTPFSNCVKAVAKLRGNS